MAHDAKTKEKAKEMLKSYIPKYVSDTLGLPLRTVYNWVREVASEERTELRNNFMTRRALYEKITKRYSDKLLDPAVMESASPRDAAVILGIMQDKLFKLDLRDTVDFTEHGAMDVIDLIEKDDKAQEFQEMLEKRFKGPGLGL
jgi:hypothetical protein